MNKLKKNKSNPHLSIYYTAKLILQGNKSKKSTLCTAHYILNSLTKKTAC